MTRRETGGVRVLSGTGILGYGFDPDSLAKALEGGLDLVACDGGSTDAGPYYLGSGEPIVSVTSIKRDLEQLWSCARVANAPVVIGSCGGSGSDQNLQLLLEIVQEIARERSWTSRVAVIHSELSHEQVLERLNSNSIQPLDGVEQLTAETVLRTSHVVGMMGTEPIELALRAGAEIVLAGRCSDAAIFAALPIIKGVDRGLAWHAGKLLECGATCAEPPGPDCIVAEFLDRRFVISPPNPARRCTVQSVMTFLLHETSDPFIHRENIGQLDLSSVQAEQVDEHAVALSGARFQELRPITLKLEGASRVGHRTVLFGATHDPRLISRINEYLAGIRASCIQRLRGSGFAESDYAINVSTYGVNGVLANTEPSKRADGCRELGVLIEAIAPSRSASQAVASSFRSLMLHADFPGRQCTEGNFAFPFSPAELDGGEVYSFNIWHTMTVDNPLQFFPIGYHQIGPHP